MPRAQSEIRSCFTEVHTAMHTWRGKGTVQKKVQNEEHNSLRLLRIYAFNNLHPNSRVAFDEIMDTTMRCLCWK